MKSLEIINERINELKGNPELECYNGQKIKYLFYNGKGAGLLTYSQLEEIQQDLEILEILKDYLYEHPKSNDNVKIISMKDIFILKQCKSEELLKLKQWLEENEE